jgi:protein-tyrosine-phosphatase
MSEPEVLFVCKNNVGRSQWAMEDYNRDRPGAAGSAGTRVDEPGGVVADWQGNPDMIIAVMREEGIDISRNRRAQLTQEMLRSYGKIVVMAQPETWPEYLEIKGKIEYWDITDPVNITYAVAKKIREEIRLRVQALANQTTNLNA